MSKKYTELYTEMIMIKLYFKQAFHLLRENKLLSSISIIGTALAIAMIMVIVITLRATIAPFAPETHRDRMLIFRYAGLQNKSNVNWQSNGPIGYNTAKACFKEMKTPEAVSITSFFRETFQKGGNVVIPSFAVGRTQEILYFIREIKEKNLLPEFPGFEVYVDSPLAIEATNVFNKNVIGCFDEDAMALVNQGINPLLFQGLKTTITSDESRQINFDTKPKVILSASGMCEAGRIRHHLKHNLWRPECTICFVGYQAVGTLGRKLIEGAQSVKLFGENITVNAKIEVLRGISGHADMNGLLDWIRGFEKIPDRVMVVHGEDTVTDHFAKLVEDTFGCPAFAPYSGGTVDLAANEIITIGQKNPKKSDEKPSKLKSASAFNRLVAAAKRLLNVVYKNEGIANKDMAKFETQIQNLADKWDR